MTLSEGAGRSRASLWTLETYSTNQLRDGTLRNCTTVYTTQSHKHSDDGITYSSIRRSER